jgi:tripartite ATP-independent transporter DctM subunit
MSGEMVGILGLVGMFILIFAGMPVAFSMILSAFLGYAMLMGFEAGVSLLASVPFSSITSYTLSVLPLFIFMGSIASFSGISEGSYYAIYRLLGHLPGGLAISTVGGCAAFAAVCGSSIATATTMTKVALPEMTRYKYDPRLALGSIAAGGTLGILIPPSINFIIYGIYAEVSVGRLFMAGFFPGFLLAGLFMLTIYIMTKRNPTLGPRGPKFSFRERMVAIRGIWAIVVLVLLVMGGIWGGIFTPTEGGGIGAAGALVIALVKRRLTVSNTIEALKDTARVSAMALFVLIGASIFSTFMAVSMLPMALASLINNLALPPVGIVIVMLIIYAVLGCIMSTIPMILLTLPIFLPVLISMQIDLIWFGVLLTVMVEMAMITPPIGINVFVLSGMAPDVPMYTIFRGVLPFVIAMVVCLVFLLAFPQISLFLPNTMIGY